MRIINKNQIKKYNQDILVKDYYISFFAGLGGGIVIWFFTLIVPYLFDKNYFNFIVGFIFYIILGVLIFFSGRYMIIKTFNKSSFTS